MKIRLISDVHTEFHGDCGKGFIAQLDVSGADVLVIAGDFVTKHTVEKAMEALAKKGLPVIYVPGNHEYYTSSFEEMDALLRDVIAKYDNIHLLDCSEKVIDDVRFLGGTLWFPQNPDNIFFKHRLNDFRIIRNFERNVYQKNNACVKFLRREVAEGDIVVTHHLPSMQSVPRRFYGEPTNAFYVTDMTPVIHKTKPKLWLHGHTHDSTDYVTGSTRVVCNPYGYDDHALNAEYNSSLTLEI